MTIGGIGGNTNAGASLIHMGNPSMDAYSKSLQKQIADAQKQLQELSQNDEMDAETKMKKRQEIQKQINDLNMQLRQHQMEERKKAQQEKQKQNQPKKSEEDAAGLSKKSMEAMISADNLLKQAKIQGGTAKQLQNGADIKRAQIKRDGGSSKRTSNDNAAVSSKWDDVESMEQHAKTAAISQASSLADAQNKLEEANAEDSANTSAKTKETGEEASVREDDAAITTAEPAGMAITAAAPEAAAYPLVTNVASTSTKQPAEIGSNIDVKV